MLRLASTAFLIALAAPVVVQTAPAATPTPAPPMNAGPSPEFIQAAQGFGQCVGTHAKGSDGKATPEVAATAALAACRTQQTAMEQRFEAWISLPSFPEAGRAIAREQMRTQMAGLPAKVAGDIRAARAAAPPK